MLVFLVPVIMSSVKDIRQSQCLHQHPGVFISHNVCTNILVCLSVTMSAPTPEWTNILVCSSVTMSAPTSWCVRQSLCLHQHPNVSVTMSAPTSKCVCQSQCLHQHPGVFISHNVCTNILECSSVTMSAPTS